jgi:hypothetical protein
MPKRWFTEDESRALLAGATWGRLATAGPDGPYITPLHHVLDGNALYFHCGLAGRRLTNLQHDPRACYEVSELLEVTAGPTACQFSTRYWSVQAFGRARLVQDEGEKFRALTLLADRFRGAVELPPVDPEKVAKTSIIALEIERISGKALVPKGER